MTTDSPNPVLIIGVGNTLRGDDGVGRYVAREIAKLSIPGVDIREEPGDGAAIMELWQRREFVFVVDAMFTGASPGAIHRFDASHTAIPIDTFPCSTHLFSLAEAVEMSRALGTLPPRLIIVGLEAKSFDTGGGITPTLQAAARDCIRQICEEVSPCMKAG